MGATTDILTGVVTDEAGTPLAGVVVEAISFETEISRMARTDQRGRYTILFPDGGGQYRLVVRSIGRVPVERLIVRQADEDRLVSNVVLTAAPTQLEDVVVRGNRNPPIGAQVPSPGTTERAFTPDQVSRLPIDASDLLLLASLVPGVVLLDATDTSGAAISVAGQRPSENNITLDGLRSGSAQVPQEALRATRVVSNTFDAARGQFSGGQIASTTRSGTNMLQGTLNYTLRDRDFTIEPEEEDPGPARGFNQHQLSGGLGGPIIRNRLFVFGSLQGRLRSDDLTSLLHSSGTSLERLGASPDSVARFLSLAGSLGVPTTSPEVGDDRSTDDFSGLARVDWLIGNRHTLALRGDWRFNEQEPSRIGQLALPQTGGTSHSRNGGVMATLSSRFGTQVLNEFRAYVSSSRQESDPLLLLPQGRVQVASALEDGTQAVSTLTFGGSTSLPQQSTRRGLEATNEVSWLPGDGSHRIKLGALYSENRSSQTGGQNANGTFSFHSLGDLEAGRPSSYTRTLTPNERVSRSREAALYFADTWRRGGGLQLTYGFRVETSLLPAAPAYNPEVEALFGLRTDELPSEVHVSPRLGFSWMVGSQSNGTPALVLRGGVGEFRSGMPGGLLGQAQSATGFPSGQTQLVCLGDAAPLPDWDAYLEDPSSVPMTCTGAPTTLPTRAPNVTAFSDGFTAPRSWRVSLGAQRRFGFNNVSLNLSWARGVSQWGYRDLNLDPVPAFTLGNEANRPVYVPAGTIPSSGSTGLFGSRLHPEYGQVLSVGSDLSSNTLQASLALNGLFQRKVLYNASYTFSRSRDQSGGGGFAAATTAGDPNLREWATSDFERRHSIVTTLTYPFSSAVELTAIGRMSSGQAYTPMVGGDINGDGSRNDRAYVFNPAASGDTAIVNGMQRLLGATSGSARECLQAQMGRIATRNSCSGPWQPTFDLQFNWRPGVLGLRNRLAISVTTVNLMGGLDQLLHDDTNLRGWGQRTRPDQTLLFVTGFDPAAREYLYTVNERFGASRQTATAFRVPFQIGFQARYTIGPDRQRQMLAAVRAGGGGGRGGFGGGDGPGRAGGAGPGGFGGGRGLFAAGDSATGGMLSRLVNLVPNPAGQVLEIRLGLRLRDSQVAALTALADSFTASLTAIADSVQQQVERAGSNPDPGRLMGAIRPALQQGGAVHQAALAEVQRILTAEQWSQVPERIKAAPRLGAGPRQEQGGGGRRPPPA